jgi:UDP-N-acetylglucosamine 2-epimerase (hydrolysing)
VTLLPPVDYLTLVHLMKRAVLVVTDSGGIQEEAPSLGRPVLVLRDVTERPEAVEAGGVRVIGTNRGFVVEQIRQLLENQLEYQRMARAINPYGDGHASERIVAALLKERLSAVEELSTMVTTSPKPVSSAVPAVI